MKEYIDREAFFRFLTEQKDKETGAYSKGRNAGLDVARSALHNREITPAADVVERDDPARVQVAHDKVGQALNVAGAFYAQGYHDAMTDHNLVERKRGEWEHRVESHHDTHTDEYWDEGYFVCSECGESWWDTTNFCPNCGCQMVGVKDGRD